MSDAKIDHLGIAVKSLAASKAFYEKLGLTVSPEETVEGEQALVVVAAVGALVDVRLGHERGHPPVALGNFLDAVLKGEGVVGARDAVGWLGQGRGHVGPLGGVDRAPQSGRA